MTSRISVLSGLLITAVGSFTVAQTPFAGEDFDSGSVFESLGLEVASPTASGLTPDTTADFARFSPTGSPFDIFGVLNRNDLTLPIPFGLIDESLEGQLDAEGIPSAPFLADALGILRSTDTDNVFVVVDTLNGDNSGGDVSATWTFDISGRSSILLSIDLAAQGDFEDSVGGGTLDDFRFEYSIDGGPVQTAFNPIANEAESIVVTRESPETVIPNFAFDDVDFSELVFGDGPFTNVDGNLIDFDPADNGLDGDAAANDGLVNVEIGGDFVQVQSYQETVPPAMAGDAPVVTVINELVEFVPVTLDDPLQLADGTFLTNVLTTFTTEIEGVGSTLTLTFNANTDGGAEFFVFDEILLSEAGDVVGQPGDFNGDGAVDALDYLALRDSNGDLSDFAAFVDNFGAGLPSLAEASAAVPEPATAILALVMSCSSAGRRRSRLRLPSLR